MIVVWEWSFRRACPVSSSCCQDADFCHDGVLLVFKATVGGEMRMGKLPRLSPLILDKCSVDGYKPFVNFQSFEEVDFDSFLIAFEGENFLRSLPCQFLYCHSSLYPFNCAHKGMFKGT